MENTAILIAPRGTADPEMMVLGLTLVERCSAMLSEFFEIKKVYAPYQERSKRFRNIEISNEKPQLGTDIIVVDPSFLFEERFLKNFSANFQPTIIASNPHSLAPLGFAWIASSDVTENLFQNTWEEVESLSNKKQNTRIAVIDSKYLQINYDSDGQKAEDFLLNTLRESHDGIISKNINRYLSLKITARTVEKNIHPMTWTLISLALGSFGSLLVLTNSWFTDILGLLLIQLSSIAAGVDGETARIKFQKTKLGRWLNMFANDLVVWPFFAAITYSITDNAPLFFFGKVLMYVYPVYIIIKYISAFMYKKEGAEQQIFSVIRNVSRNLKKFDYEKQIPLIVIEMIKRDFIIFFSLILALTNYLRVFPLLYVLSITGILSVPAIRYFKEKRMSEPDEKSDSSIFKRS